MKGRIKAANSVRAILEPLDVLYRHQWCGQRHGWAYKFLSWREFKAEADRVQERKVYLKEQYTSDEVEQLPPTRWGCPVRG